MATAPFSIRLDAKLKARLEKEAKRRDRPLGYIINRAVENYFSELDRVRQELDDAFEQADKGVFISGEKVTAWMRSWGTENELPPPEPDIFPQTQTTGNKTAGNKTARSKPAGKKAA